ncbi:MAG: monovalent cation/H+ antiporter subunit D [Gammaproteobacteria bacterium]|nr:monovalent cation/H+ antiporter subunit D [Gammaproteobacteria bacterium]
MIGRPMTSHLPILPILLPFVAGLVLLALSQQPVRLRRVFSLVAVLAQIGLAWMLLLAVADGSLLVYRLGDWAAPWGIVLVADRLAALMLLITTLVAAFALWHATDGLDQRGRYFHVLFQLQLFGLAGAFLTGDLFNLFVFFEILLLASYGLLLHGGGAVRVRSGLHYVVLNLLGSSVFLFAAGLIYAGLGSLNMADIAHKAASLSPDNLGLARAGGLLLLAVFALKAALLPLHLWLPAAYSSTAAPVAALFAIMTKVGAYSILRSHTLMFGESSGDLANLFTPWLLPLALATLLLGSLGALAARRLGRLAAYLVIGSVGALLTAFSLGEQGIAAGLYYLPHSTFAAAALFLLAEAIGRRRPFSGDLLQVDADMPRIALWGGLFFFTAVLIGGLPPLSGFIGKLLILRAAMDHPGLIWVWSLILISALIGIIALARAGSRLFFQTSIQEGVTPAVRAPVRHELIAILGLLGLTLLLTLLAGPALDFTQATATQLLDTQAYVQAILGTGEVRR